MCIWVCVVIDSVRPMLMSDIWHRRIGGKWTHRRWKGNGAPTADAPNLQRRVYDVAVANWVQPDTSTLCARGSHKMSCMTAPLCGNGMAGRRGAVISWCHSSSIVRIAAVRQATQAGTSRHVMNALSPLLNMGNSHSPSSTVDGEVECYLATPAVDWWREKLNSTFLASRVSPSPQCFRPKIAWCLRILIFS